MLRVWFAIARGRGQMSCVSYNKFSFATKIPLPAKSLIQQGTHDHDIASVLEHLSRIYSRKRHVSIEHREMNMKLSLVLSGLLLMTPLLEVSRIPFYFMHLHGFPSYVVWISGQFVNSCFVSSVPCS
jgi:hypothetical protein